MKTNFFYILTGLLLVVLFTTNCKKEDVNDLIEENGLSKDINDFISQDILDILDSLDMPINTGGNPVKVEGTYLYTPVILTNTTRENDEIGKLYADINLTFSEQDNNDLTLKAKFLQGSTEGEAYGSFVVGSGDKFSVFTKIKTYNEEYGDSSLTSRIFSGTLTDEGIEDLYHALVMIDDYGDPYDRFIEIGDARVFYDEDGISEGSDEIKSASKDRLIKNYTDENGTDILQSDISE